MSEPKDFVVVPGSDARKTQTRVLFVTRRKSAAVKSVDEAQVQTYPAALLRVGLAIELLTIGLVSLSLFADAPLEGLADPTNTPNPAKAPWYFLGLQELLHYFPPVVAGVLIPTVFIVSLIVIPYFNINVEAEGMFLKDRKRRLRIFLISAVALSIFLAVFDVIVALVPTVLIALVMLLAAYSSPQSKSRFRRYLAAQSVSWWIMTWFLIDLAVLTAVGTFFRGPGWSWVLPWGN